MKKLRKFNLEDDYLEIKESLEYPTLSLTDDSGKVWVKQYESYIICKYYINEEDVNKGKNVPLFANEYSYYSDFYHMIDYYIIDDEIRVDRYKGTASYNNFYIDEYYTFSTVGEHTVKLYININKMINDGRGDEGFFAKGLDFTFAFSSCNDLISVDFSNFKESNMIESMNNMFDSCPYLTSVTFGNNFNTSNVTNMRSMFSACQNLISLDLSSFDTSKVTDMSHMFSSCWNLTSLNLSGWDISKVENGTCAFYGFDNDIVIGVDPTLDIFNCMPA